MAKPRIEAAIPEVMDLGQGRTCRSYRCPGCNAWDCTITDEDAIPGFYLCQACGTEFEIRRDQTQLGWLEDHPEESKARSKAFLGVFVGTCLIIAIVVGAMAISWPR